MKEICYYEFEVIAMMVLYGGIDMLIKRIHIYSLHGQYDYDIEFDS